MTNVRELRRHPRFVQDAQVSLSTERPLALADDYVEPLALQGHDLSLAGISLELPVPLSPNTDVALVVTLPQLSSPFKLFGTVAWCAAPRGNIVAGIALDLSRADGDRWAALFDPQYRFHA